MTRHSRLSATLALTALLALPANAADIQSAYTKIDFDDCLVMDTHEMGAGFACPGWRGMPLYVAEGDLRFFVSYGFGAPEEMAARQTLPAFNRIGTTLEWRLSNRTGPYRPFATILRWITDDPESAADGEVLVVTRIEPGNTCHVAYVDAKLVMVPGASPNEIARTFADEFAPGFDCETDEPHYYPS